MRHGLPFGAKAADPKALETYPFSHDAKVRPAGPLSLLLHCLPSSHPYPLPPLSSAPTSCRTPSNQPTQPPTHPPTHPNPTNKRQPLTDPTPPQTCKIFWDVRKGLIPIVGAAREAGTSMLIEDVACPVDKLADMMIDLIDMFQVGGGDEGWFGGSDEVCLCGRGCCC